MKIEKINDNQIRCILTREDLEQRQIRLSELAYGSDKAKSLFQDMMRQAAFLEILSRTACFENLSEEFYTGEALDNW